VADVETSLLKTKLNIPPARASLVPRPCLMERLQESCTYNFVFVSAPAGFGKTTLLSEWARISQPEVRTAWLSLDEGDSDPIRFWDYFIAALQTVQPEYGEKILPWLHSSQPPSVEPLLTALINDFSGTRGDFAVVLDDYHLIESQQIHDGITYLIEHLPVQVHMVIAARADPPLPLAHFRGKGMMLEIRTDDLRFTLDDTASLLKELKTPGLSAKDIAALNDRTEGWVVGLKMAALSMKGQKDIPGFIAAFTGSQRYVMDYLMEEVLKKQSQEIRDFLMKTSILERLSSPSCDFVTGRKDSQEILLSLEHGHLFIVPLDESRQWYRYEHLFDDLLRHQCETVYGTEQVAALHRKASQWYEDNNLPDEAIHHALKAEDWQQAIRLIDAHGEAHRKRGEFNTLLGWLQAIPHEVLREQLRLYSQYAALLAAVGQLNAAEAALNYLESRAQDDTALQGEAAFVRGMVYRHRGDTKRCIELFEKAFALAPPDDVAMRCRAAMSIAHARQRYGSLQEAEKWATQACELGQQAGDILAVIMAMSQMGIIAAYQGKMKRAVEIFEKENEFASQAASPFGARNELCYIQYILNDLDVAAENARLAVESGKLSGDVAIMGLFCQAQICQALGDSAGTAAAMSRMDQASRHPTIDSFWYAHYIACRITFAIQRGNLEEAATWGAQLPNINGMMLIDWHIPARLLLAQGKKGAAAKLFQELYDSFVRFGALSETTRVRVYQALVADNEESALEFLSEALTAAAPEGIIRFFVDEGKLLKPLLEKALSRRITPGFTKKLLDIIEEEERQRQARKRATAPLPSGLLSEREREVLRLLADDIPNQRIAAKLSVSLGTVKTHVHHIIAKLEVKDRRQAVQRARELKLL
jgi:LuxR family maltose regulon positive regulatory protein